MKHRIITDPIEKQEIPRPCTGKQTKRIIRHLVKMGPSYASNVAGAVRVEPAALRWLGGKLNRKVTTITDLTWEEAYQIIALLPDDLVVAEVKE